MSAEIHLTIDGHPVTTQPGTLIVDAAKTVGIDIPVFCYHPKMEPVGMCRMCLVEIGRPVMDRTTNKPVVDENGEIKIQYGPKLETACTTPVSEGMVVIGLSDKVKAARNDVLELLLTSHPLDCPVCDKGGECPLQNLTLRFGPGFSRFEITDKKHSAKHVPLGDLIYLDRERCIQCARCVRFQKDVVDDPVIGFYNRGRSLEIMTNSEPGFDSIFSGNTTDICPVGALTTADFRFGARPWELKTAASICTHCPVGCNLVYNTRREVKAGGKVVIKRALPRQNEAVNELWLCDKGRLGYHFAESSERLQQPLIRKAGELVPASWEEALGLVSDKIRTSTFNLNILAGGRLSNEDLFNLKELAAASHGNYYLYSQMAGGDLTAQIGLDSQTDLGKLGAGTTFVVVASDLHQEAPIYWLRIKNAVKRGAKLVVANARDTRLDKIANYSIRYPYGREAQAITTLMPDSPEADEINQLLSQTENLIVFYGSDGTSLQTSQDLANACASLLSKTLHAGKPNSGLLAVWQRANDQGAWELGYQPAADLQKVFAHSGVLYIAAADPVEDQPQLTAGSHSPGFMIVQDLFLTETAKLADVVLPAQAMMERDGSYTNAERRVQRFLPIIPALPGTLADYEIAAQIRQRVLRMSLDASSAPQTFLALAVHTPAFAGLNYQKLAETTLQWPLVGREDLYYGGTGYANEQGLGVKLPTTAEKHARLDIPEVNPSGQALVLEPLVGVPVTILYDQGVTLQPSSLLKSHIPTAYTVIHPDTATQLNLTVGMSIKIIVQGVPYPAQVRLDEGVPVGTLIIPRSLGIPLAEPQTVQVAR
jgi:NADH-quinone oxidoreductase subunit G